MYIYILYMVTTPPRTYLEHWPWEALPCQDPGPIALGHMHLALFAALDGSWKKSQCHVKDNVKIVKKKGGKTVLKIWVQNCRKLWFENFIEFHGFSCITSQKKKFRYLDEPSMAVTWMMGWWCETPFPTLKKVQELQEIHRSLGTSHWVSRYIPKHICQIGWDLQITYAII